MKLLSFYYIQVILESLKVHKSTRSQQKVVAKTILATVSFKTPILRFCSELLKIESSFLAKMQVSRWHLYQKIKSFIDTVQEF